MTRRPSRLELQFAAQLDQAGLPVPERELRFHATRAWRFDFSWPDRLIACEIEGGVWSRGRHVRGQGFIDDCEKLNAAALLGWRVFRFPESMLNDGTALRVMREALR